MKKFTYIIYFALSIACLSAAPVASRALSVPLVLAAAVFLTLTALEKNYIWSGAATLLSVGIVVFVSRRHLSALSYIAGPIFAFLGFYFSYKKNLSFRNTVLLGSIGFLIQFIVLYIAGNIFSNINFITEFVFNLRDTMLSELYRFASSIKEQGVDIDVNNIHFIEKLYDAAFNTILVIAPSILAAFCGILSYISVLMIKKIEAKRGIFMNFPPFSTFYMPYALLTIFVFMFLIQLAAKSDASAVGIIANITLLIALYATVCGLSTIDFFLRKKFKRTWQRLALYIPFSMLIGGMSVTFLPVVNPFILLFLVGIADSVFDFRKLRKPLWFNNNT